jgi:hypothetical protein
LIGIDSEFESYSFPVEQLASPDFPAQVCYLIVVLLGLVVAFSKVNRLMASSPGRWGFLGTWWVFGAYAAVPVLLFWLLDYTNALHDTSLFSALLVALGYRQILAGEMKGVAAPGQVSKLWSPLEAWANTVRDLIVTKSKLYSDRFSEKVRAHMAAEPDRVQRLVELAYQMTTDQASLGTDLAALNAAPAPVEITPDAFERVRTRRKVERCLQAVRLASPEDYGFALLRRRLIKYWQYKYWLGNATALGKQVLGMVCIFGLVGGFVLGFYRPAVLDWYHRWRFAKVNVTERDRFRTREFFERRLAQAKQTKAIDPVFNPLMRWLSYRDLDRRLGDDILRLLVDYHDPALDRFTVPVLIDSLRTENPDMRLRIHQTLSTLRRLDFGDPPKDDELMAWVPSKNDSPETVEAQIKKYREWWAKTGK